MDGMDEDDKTEVLPSTETDAPVKNEESTLTEEQWSAAKDVLHNLLEYREEE